MKVDPLSLVFREYDIRGIAGEEFDEDAIKEYEKWYGDFPGVTITPENSREIGRAYGTHLRSQNARKVLVGFEIRPYSNILKDQFIEGITETGIDVHDASEMCTPFIYFLTAELEYDGGVIITGSHNVYFFNGYKILQKNGRPLYGKELHTLYDRIQNHDYDLVDTSKKGKKFKLENGYEIYSSEVLKKVKIDKPLRVCLDCGNGTPGMFVMDFFKRLGVEVVEALYIEPNAKFPNHVPNPESDLYLGDLIKSVKNHKADIGIAFDADGDRVGFIDEKGNYIDSDKILMLFAKHLAPKNQGKTILYDIKSSGVIPEVLENFGLKSLIHRTGHGPIKDTLRNDPNIILGGELSGHFYFTQDYPKADDGFFAAAKMIELLSNENKPLSELIKFIPKRVATPELKIPVEDEHKFMIVDEVKNILSRDYEVITIDGVRAQFNEYSWGLIRCSNTSPYLSIRIESKTEKEVLKYKKMFKEILDKYPEIDDHLNERVVRDRKGKLGYV